MYQAVSPTQGCSPSFSIQYSPPTLALISAVSLPLVLFLQFPSPGSTASCSSSSCSSFVYYFQLLLVLLLHVPPPLPLHVLNCIYLKTSSIYQYIHYQSKRNEHFYQHLSASEIRVMMQCSHCVVTRFLPWISLPTTLPVC